MFEVVSFGFSILPDTDSEQGQIGCVKTEGDFQLPARQLTPSARERIIRLPSWRLLLPNFWLLRPHRDVPAGFLEPDAPSLVLGPAYRASPAQENRVMVESQAESLRKAIENLIDAKLHDAMSKPGGLDRLVAHRRTGVASYDIRMAERKLQESISELLVQHEPEFSH